MGSREERGSAGLWEPASFPLQSGIGIYFLEHYDPKRIYGHKSTRSMVLPAENDGTVSVASETAPEAVRDAVKVQGFDEDHVSILSNDGVIRLVEKHLDD